MFLYHTNFQKTFFAALTLTIFVSAAIAQPAQDVCHVYVVDVEKVKKALENFRESGNAEADKKALSAGQTIFPEFRTEFQEEKLFTKHYPFPDSKLVITASVYYTDESMASHPHGIYKISNASIILGVTVSDRAHQSALSSSTPNSAITEVTYDEFTNVIRAKQYVKVGTRFYLVGIQCDCMGEKGAKGDKNEKN